MKRSGIIFKIGPTQRKPGRPRSLPTSISFALRVVWEVRTFSKLQILVDFLTFLFSALEYFRCELVRIDMS